MATPQARRIFSSLNSLMTSLDPLIPERAMVLYNTAIRKTGNGSGHELPADIRGNHNGIAAACLMLASIEANGVSEIVQQDYQRLSSIDPKQYQNLVKILKGVLELRGTAGEVVTTPTTRSSARKRKRSIVDEDEQDNPESTTPTKPTKSATSTTKKTPTRPTASSSKPRTTPRSARVEELSRGTVSGSRKGKMEEDLDSISSSITVDNEKSPTRRSTRTIAPSGSSGKNGAVTVVSGSGSKKAIRSSPTKASSSTAFEKAISAPSPSRTTTPTKPKPSTAFTDLPAYAKVQQEAEVVEEEPIITIPYEPYVDDMLLRWRRKDKVQRMWEATERWRVEMLERLEGAEVEEGLLNRSSSNRGEVVA